MVKLAKGAKMQNKPKKAAPPPPKEVEDSDEEEDMEEDDSSEEEVEVPVKKTPAKKAATPAKATPAKATPAKKAATPAKAAATPGKKGATPAAAKNGKQAKKQESEDEEDSDEESEEEQKPAAKKPVSKKPVAKEESEDEEDDEDDESEEEKPVAKKPAATKPVAKKPAKEESEDEDEEDSEEDDDEEMEVTPAAGKKATPAKQEEEEEDDDDEEEEEDDDEDEDEEETVGESGKRKKEIPKAAVPEKKQKTESSVEGLSVFVANLNSSKDFDELKEALREFFSKKNLPVQDVRIGASKKFGYVEFSSEEEVEKALKLNGKKVLGFEMKLDKAMAFDKNKSAEAKKERDSRTLFVKNLPYSSTSEDLQEYFENAKEIRVPTGKDGSSKGIAYVEFNSESEADKALQEKQGTEIEGRAIFLDFTGEKSQNSGGKRSASTGGDSKTLVVNNLSYNATEDSLQEVFEKAISIRVPQNNQGRPKGFAFVEFSTVEEAKEAMESLNNTEIEGRSVRLEFSTGGGPQGGGRGAPTQSKTLFVKGLSEDTTEDTLKEAFDGSVNARIVTDRDTGTSKGFGFVDFSSAEDAKAAKEAMEDGEIDGSRVTLDFAKPKGDGPRGGGRGGGGGFGRGGFGGRGGGGRGGFGGRGGGGRGGFGGRGGGRGRGGFGGRGGGGFRGGNQPQGKKIKFDD